MSLKWHQEIRDMNLECWKEGEGMKKIDKLFHFY